jgi:hypothetical protein
MVRLNSCDPSLDRWEGCTGRLASSYKWLLLLSSLLQSPRSTFSYTSCSQKCLLQTRPLPGASSPGTSSPSNSSLGNSSPSNSFSEPRLFKMNLGTTTLGPQVPPTVGCYQSSWTSNVAPRTRLPPRSRTGCWTCRTRKVKCGEERPACAQCTRLGHTCDYSPRLSFRDDTPRVVERMQDVTTLGSSVWDRKCLARASRQLAS